MAEQAQGISKKDVVNITGGVETEGGRTLYGFDAELYLRMKAKEDPELERKVGEWIEDVVGHEIEDTSNLWQSLKSGIVLVELINTICPDTIKKYNKKDKLHVLMERENISLYLEGCWKLGLSADYMFLPPDLHSRTNIAAVINNLIALSDIANYFGFVKVVSLRTGEIPQESKHMIAATSNPNTQPTEPKKPKAPAKKWTVPIPTGPTYVGQLDGNSDPEYIISQLRKDLEAAQLKNSTLEYSNGLLKEDLKAARKKNREEGVTANAGGGGNTAELLEQIRKLKTEKMKLMIENESLRKSARARGALAGPTTDPQQKILSACKELKGLVTSILNPDHQVRKEHCIFLEDWFKSEDAMRRTFASVLRETLFEKNKGEEVELSTVSFDALVYLITCLLDNSNPHNGADVISGKYVLQCCYLVYKKPSIFNKEWCQETIKSHKFWTDVVFWEEYFWEKMARKYQNLSDNTLLFSELKAFAPSIVPWGQNTAESALTLFQNISAKIDLGDAKLDEAATEQVETEIKQIANKQKAYVRSSTGLNIRNVLWGVAAQHIEAPMQDLKVEIKAGKDLQSLSSNSKERTKVEPKSEPTKQPAPPKLSKK